jgi:Mn2+/Fe2+ NRAMP family transporter
VLDHANGDTAETRDPPQSIGGTLRYLGPGLIISASLVGSGELIATTKLGAETGFTLLWLILLGCFLKVFVQIELARYAVSSGETTLTAFNRLPGPRLRANWVLWLYLTATALTYAALGGVIGGIVQAFALAAPVNTTLVALLVVAFTIAVLVLGRYQAIEKMATLLVLSFTFVTFFTIIALQATDFAFTRADVFAGLRFGFPEDVSPVATALAAFGLIGVTGAELVSYPYWCVEKGYARFTGNNSDDPGWLERAQGWVRVMRTDAFAAFLIYTTATAAFYLLGAAVLHRQGLNPDGLQLVSTLAEAYVPVFGEFARWLLVIGAIAVLYSTYMVAIGASARVLTDFAGVMHWVNRENPESVRRSVAVLSILLPLFTLAVFLSGTNPVRLIIIGGIAQALFLPVASLGVLYLRYRHTDPRLAPGRAWDIAVILSSLSLVIVGVLGLWRLAGG